MNENTIKSYAKEVYQFVTELLMSPLQTVQKKHELNWTQILVYFSSVSILSNMVLMILSGGFAMMIFFPVQMTITQIVYLGIMLWLSVLILKKNEITIDERELAQVWLKGAILGSIANLALGVARISMFSVFGGLTVLIPAILIAGSTYIYLHKTKTVEKEKARNMSIIVAVVVGILPFGSYSGLYWLF